MNEEQEPANENLSKQSIDPQRARALDLAFMATRLLDEKYFGDVSQAVKTNNKELFLKTCEVAELPPDIANAMWDMLRFLPGGW